MEKQRFDALTQESLHHGPRFHPDGSVTWAVWAPRAEEVKLVLDPGGAEQTLPMHPASRGWFLRREPAIAEGRRYLFEIEGRRLPDPASRWQPDGVHQASALFHPAAFTWQDHQWRGLALGDLVLYELHVGAFTSQGDFDAAIERLPALRDLGITAVEVMPIAQFAGRRGWGYDGVYPFAVQQSYGGPRAFQRFINACHEQGLGVFLDVVYNHFGPEGNYLSEFAYEYFTNKYFTPWGAALNFDGRRSDAVRQLVLENVSWWLREFHLDGLRLDAVHAIYDGSAKHLLREIREVADQEAEQAGRPLYITAESNLNDVRLLDSADKNGFGLAAQWSDDFHHCVHTLLTGELAGYYADFGQPEQLAKALEHFFVFDGCYSPYRGRRHGGPVGDHTGERFIISIQNHDQVGNRALGERFGQLLTPAQQRLAAGLLLLAPNVPMLFMGEEYGERNPFPFFCDFHDPVLISGVQNGRAAEFESFAWPERIPDPFADETFRNSTLTWDWSRQPQLGLRRWYQRLLRARKEIAALQDFAHRAAKWYNAGIEARGIVELTRGKTSEGSAQLLAYFSLLDRAQPLPEDCQLRRHGGRCTMFCSSEESEFGGSRQESFSALPEQPRELLPFEVQVYLFHERHP